MKWARIAAVVACGASSLVVARNATAARHLTLGPGEGFFVGGTQVACLVVDGTNPPLRDLLCALANRRTRKALVQSRWGMLTEASLLVHRAPTEGGAPEAASTVLFYHQQPSASAGVPFADVRGHRPAFVLSSGDTVSIGGTHIRCADVRTRLTCTKVSVPKSRTIPGAYGLVIAGDTIGVVHAVGKTLVPLASWPLLAGHS
jgi:hypothetical protein